MFCRTTAAAANERCRKSDAGLNELYRSNAASTNDRRRRFAATANDISTKRPTMNPGSKSCKWEQAPPAFVFAAAYCTGPQGSAPSSRRPHLDNARSAGNCGA